MAASRGSGLLQAKGYGGCVEQSKETPLNQAAGDAGDAGHVGNTGQADPTPITTTTVTTTQPPKRKLRVRAWHVVFLAVLVAATLGLAWWQWTRFQSGSGTFQNLGYALQWPFFGAFFVYAYRKFMEYENATREDKPVVVPKQTALDESFLPKRTTLSVEEFNELNRPTRHNN